MQNAEMKLVRLDSGDVITASNPQTVTFSNLGDGEWDNETFTFDSTGASWDKLTTLPPLWMWLNTQFSLPDNTITKDTIVAPNEGNSESLEVLVGDDAASDSSYSRFNATFQWIDGQFKYYQ